MDTYDMALIAMFSMIAIIFLFGMVYWFGGEREANNMKDEQNRWTQQATVMEKTNHWWGTSCLLNANDGKRYYEDYCRHYIEGDKVIIEMSYDRYRWIKGISDTNMEEQK